MIARIMFAGEWEGLGTRQSTEVHMYMKITYTGIYNDYLLAVA